MQIIYLKLENRTQGLNKSEKGEQLSNETGEEKNYFISIFKAKQIFLKKYQESVFFELS